MKKNVFLKLASALLVLCLASTCAIGTTFAKYTTADRASDTARVAKWGMVVSTSGTLFGTSYAENASGNGIMASISESVEAFNHTDTIVAPGTKNETGFQILVNGAPEVAYDVLADNGAGTMEDIWLKAGNYGVMVEAYGINPATDFSGNDIYKSENAKDFTRVTAWEVLTGSFKYYRLHDVATTANDYYPIVWTVAKIGATTPAITNTHLATVDGTAGIAKEIATNLAALAGNANAEIDFGYTLTWEWKFSDGNDALDTILGNLSANDANQVVVKTTDSGATYAKVAASDYNLDINFELNVTVNQVD